MSPSKSPSASLWKVRDWDRVERGKVGERIATQRGCYLLRFKDGTKTWIAKDSLEEIRGVVQ